MRGGRVKSVRLLTRAKLDGAGGPKAPCGGRKTGDADRHTFDSARCRAFPDDAVTSASRPGHATIARPHRRRLSIITVDGPEHLSGDWWRADTYARDYWRCVAEDEGELLLYHEVGERWYLQGWYD